MIRRRLFSMATTDLLFLLNWTGAVRRLNQLTFNFLYKCRWIHLSGGFEKLGNNDKWITFAFILMLLNSQWEKRRWLVLWCHNKPWWTCFPRSSLHSEQILEDASQNVQNWGDRFEKDLCSQVLSVNDVTLMKASQRRDCVSRKLWFCLGPNGCYVFKRCKWRTGLTLCRSKRCFCSLLIMRSQMSLVLRSTMVFLLNVCVCLRYL